MMVRKGNFRALYNCPEYIKYYEEVGDDLFIGRGALKPLLKGFGDVIKTYNICQAPLSEEFKAIDSFKLRKYQKGIVAEIIVNGSMGIIKLSVGFGKTLISLKLIEALQKKTLIITHRESILNQFKQEAKEWFNYDVGVIQGKTWNVKDITIASINTLNNRDLAELKDKFGMIIVDEAHTFVSKKRLEVIQAFNPQYLYGLSGTPERSEADGQTKAIFFTFGDIVVDKKLPQKKPDVKVIKTNIDIPIMEYPQMIDEQVKDKDRNNLICNIIEQELANHRRILVLTKRVKHYENIYDALDIKDGVFKVSSKNDNEDLLYNLRSDNIDFNVILSTFSLLSTGVDIPTLDTLIIAGDLKSSVLTGQSVGRSQRLFKNKMYPKVIDMCDNMNPILYRQYLSRRRLYLREDWNIISQ